MLLITVYQFLLFIFWPCITLYLLILRKPEEKKTLYRAIVHKTITSILTGILTAGGAMVALSKMTGTIRPNIQHLNIYFGVEMLLNSISLLSVVFTPKNIKFWNVTYILYIINNFIAIGLLLAYLHTDRPTLTLWGGLLINLGIVLFIIGIYHCYRKDIYTYRLFLFAIFVTNMNAIQYLPIKEFLSFEFWTIPNCCNIDTESPFMIFQHIFGFSSRLTVGDIVMYILCLCIVGLITLINNIITEEALKQVEMQQPSQRVRNNV